MARQQQHALITGGGSGIGLAIARALLGRGWCVSICGRTASKLEKARQELADSDGASGTRIFAMPADVSQVKDIRQWIEHACVQFGDPTLLVNNAGVGERSDIASLKDEALDHILNVNLRGPFLVTREALPRLRAAGGGWVVNIASLGGKKGMPGLSAYCASKFGLVGFTESLAREEAKHGIRATAICPGHVATPLVEERGLPVSESIQPEDIAATVLYLLDLSPKVVIREIVLERIDRL